MSYHDTAKDLVANPKRWLVTGAAGFIGSHLVAELLKLGQTVTALDNLSTGYEKNIDLVAEEAGENGERLTFIEGDIVDLDACRSAVEGVDFILHQAALGSVPRSIDDPLASHRSNVDGFVNMLVAAKDAAVKRFVYASSSSVYGDLADSPKVEARIGAPLSPYAVTKRVNEIYADNFALVYPIQTVGLRYFNVFGPRQDPNGAYAAVIPRWVDEIIQRRESFINGDGETSRDFCYVQNVVQANILAATSPSARGAYNIACGESTTLNELFRMIRESLERIRGETIQIAPTKREFRVGDVRHSLADTSRAQKDLGYAPVVRVDDGIERTVGWFAKFSS